jgi:hypothetical protein
MSGRPANDPVDWASDEAWSDPSEAWDGEPPIAVPSAGYISQGHLPDKPIPADYANWYLNDLFARARYVDAIDVQNYPLSAAVNASGNNAGDMAAMTWHASNRLLYVAGGTQHEIAYSSYDDGASWAAEYTSAGNKLPACCTRDRNDAQPTNLASAILVNLAASTLSIATRGTSGGAWVTTALTNGFTGSKVKPDPYQGGFWISGRDTALFSCIWRFTDNGGGAGFAQAQYTTGVAGTDFETLAVSNGRVIASAWSGATATIFSKPSGSAAALAAVTHPGAATERVMSIVWCEAYNRFVMLTQDASPGTKVYYSSLGTSGTWATVASTVMGDVDVVQVGGACVRGSVIVVPVKDLTPRYWLAVSYDGALTWELIPDPLKRFGTNAAFPTVARVLDRRIAVAGYRGTGVHDIALGLRTGRS